MDTIPDEVIDIISQYLEMKDLRSFALTCKRIYNISKIEEKRYRRRGMIYYNVSPFLSIIRKFFPEDIVGQLSIFVIGNNVYVDGMVNKKCIVENNMYIPGYNGPFTAKIRDFERIYTAEGTFDKDKLVGKYECWDVDIRTGEINRYIYLNGKNYYKYWFYNDGLTEITFGLLGDNLVIYHVPKGTYEHYFSQIDFTDQDGMYSFLGMTPVTYIRHIEGLIHKLLHDPDNNWYLFIKETETKDDIYKIRDVDPINFKYSVVSRC